MAKVSSKSTPEQAQGVQRDDKGHFMPGVSGNPSGRPRGASCKALRMAREWAETTGIKLLIEQAEAGNVDAAKALVNFGLPRLKPVDMPLEGLEGLPVPNDKADLGDAAEFVARAVADGTLSVSDATRLMELLERITQRLMDASWIKCKRETGI